MKYVCLAYENEAKINALSRREWETLREETLACVAGLQDGGHYVLAAALASTRSATTVRIRNGRLSTTDGPFAETKEQLGGIILIEAHDLNEAIRIAGRWPSARLGSIEVRPIVDPLPLERRYELSA